MNKTGKPTISKLLNVYGAVPFTGTSPAQPTASTMLAHLSNEHVAQYAHLPPARREDRRYCPSRWLCRPRHIREERQEERTPFLTDGGCTHYREKTTTQLGDLAARLRSKYLRDLNNLLQAAKDDNSSQVRDSIRRRL